MSRPEPGGVDLVLVGGGHAHVHVLKELGTKYKNWRKDRDVRVTLIAKDVHTPYSGMLPGFIAGHYSYDQIHVDLENLCRFSQVRLINAAAEKVSYDERTKTGFVHCQHNSFPPIRFDCLSINIGSAPAQNDLVERNENGSSSANGVVPVKPISSFSAFYERLVDEWQRSDMGTEDKVIAIVGGGAGGLEVALSLQYRLSTIRSENHLKVLLITRGAKLLQGHNCFVQKKFVNILKQRGVPVYFNSTVTAVEAVDGKKFLTIIEKTDPLVVDNVMWCVTAGVAPWLRESTPFATTVDGFLRVESTYESVSHCGIFAAGDCCSNESNPRPKAGVFAVRAGPILADNLVRYLSGRTLLVHTPQKEFLGIISAGSKYAVASKSWWLCFPGRLVWYWKDFIDRRWMAKYSEFPSSNESNSQ